MAENENGAQEASQDNQPQVGLISQYIKDLSFENPNTPQSFEKLNAGPPKIEVNVNVGGEKINDEMVEVEVKLSATAKHDDENTFVVEVLYAGLFGMRNVPEESMQPFMMVNAPTLLFPFVRRVIADVTRDGGYPPLLLDPIDFNIIYQQSLQNKAEKGGEA